MKITLWPDLAEWSIKASVSGDTITINDDKFDFSPLAEGYRLPQEAIGSKYFVEGTHIERIGGEVHLTLRFPVQWDSPVEVRSPATATVITTKRGAVKFPDASPVIDKPVDAVVTEVAKND